MPTPQQIAAFVERWRGSGAAERANYQLFLSELCDILAVPRPEPTVPEEVANRYVFEKSVPLPHGTTGRIDLYRRGCFVLEAKQGEAAAGKAGSLLPPPLPTVKARKGVKRHWVVGYRDGARP